MRERERKKEKEKEKESKLLSSIFGVPSSEFVEPRIKVHLLDKGYVWVLKTRDFAEDSSDEFGKSKVSGLRSVYETS